jgi:50S ribosomal protein L16 3-hydroxylase
MEPARFLAEHWQKQPLLVRQAIPGFRGLVSAAQLAKLAAHPRAAARTVTKGKHWRLHEGPFGILDVARMPKRDFTLLVQGVEQHIDGAWELLQQFSFIPTARIDDLMVSYAVPGGSVGPHFDLYDVFLLQGTGRRRWQIAADGDLACIDDGDLRVLERFVPTHEWVLEPGDMLYLPPKVGHWGTAIDPCMTYSIGFSAPSHEQLVHNFLAFLAASALPGDGLYEDADLALQPRPAELGDDAIARVERVLDQLRWDRECTTTFLGRLLTGPKPSMRFAAPRQPLDARAFAAKLASPGTLVLAKASRMLSRGDRFFVNGEVLHARDPRTAAALRSLADTRALALPVVLTDQGRVLVYDLYRAGFVVSR